VRDLSDEHPSRFSYNLWEIEPDPDRDAEKSTADLHHAIARLWATVSEPSLIRLFLVDASDPNRFEYHADFYWGDASRLLEDVKPVWEATWLEIYGRNSVLWTDSGWARAAEMYGYRIIRYPWSISEFLQRAIPSDRSVSEARIEELKKPRPTPPHELTPQQAKHLEVIQWLHSQVEFPNHPSLIVSFIPEDPRTGEIARGLYNPLDNTIYIQTTELDSMTRTIEVYVHEMGHFVSEGAMDGTREHMEGIQRVAAIITRLLTQNPSHPIWSEVIWE